MTVAAAEADTRELVQDLRRRVAGEVRFDKMSRVLYSTDASMYQIEPIGVVLPQSEEDVVAIVETANTHGVPVLPRGGGTSLAGQAVGRAVVIDFSKYMRDLLDVNVEEGWARTQPGIVLDELNLLLRPKGVQFAPDPSTSNRGQRRRGHRKQLVRSALDRLRQDRGQRTRSARRALERRPGDARSDGRRGAGGQGARRLAGGAGIPESGRDRRRLPRRGVGPVSQDPAARIRVQPRRARLPRRHRHGALRRRVRGHAPHRHRGQGQGRPHPESKGPGRAPLPGPDRVDGGHRAGPGARTGVGRAGRRHDHPTGAGEPGVLSHGGLHRRRSEGHPARGVRGRLPRRAGSQAGRPRRAHAKKRTSRTPTAASSTPPTRPGCGPSARPVSA